MNGERFVLKTVVKINTLFFEFIIDTVNWK